MSENDTLSRDWSDIRIVIVKNIYVETRVPEGLYKLSDNLGFMDHKMVHIIYPYLTYWPRPD